MPKWRFRNRTQDFLYEPIHASVSLLKAQPCQLDTFTCLVPDPDGLLAFEERDEQAVEYAIDDVNFVDLFAGDLSAFRQTHLEKATPRVWVLTAQDYTARLDWTVIEDGNRTVTETVTDRVLWIMSHAPTHDLTTGGVATIAATVEPFDYSGMTKREALDQVARIVLALYYCAGKELQFFLQDDPPSNPAPFDLAYPENPPAAYTYHDFDLVTDPLSQVDEVIARGDDVSVKRTRVGAPAAPERRQRGLNFPTIHNLSDLSDAADRELALYGTAERTGSLVTYQPGLESAMTVTIENSEWASDEGWVITSISIRPLTGNEAPSPGLAEFGVHFAQQFACRLALDVNDLAREGTKPPTGGCTRAVAILPAGMDEQLSLAFGVVPNIYVGSPEQMVKYRAGLELIWDRPIAAHPRLVGHEAGTATPLLVAPLGIRTDNGDTRWDIGDVEPAAAQVMDRPDFWLVAGGAIQFVGVATTAPETNLPAGWQEDDLAIVLAVSTGTTIPTLPAGWTNIASQSVNGGSPRLGYRILQAGDTTTGDWDQSNHLIVMVYRGAHPTAPIGAHAVGGMGLEQSYFPALTPGTAGSWVAGLAYSATGRDSTVPGMVSRVAGNGALSVHMVGADTDGPVADFAEAEFGNFTQVRSYSVELKVGSFGGGGAGTVLQSRDMMDGSLNASVALDEATTQIRRTPNGQSLYVLQGTDTLEVYSRAPALTDTVTIADFTDGLQDWNVDDAGNIYRLEANVLTKYDPAGAELLSRDLFAERGYRFPSRLNVPGGTGQQLVVDDFVRVVGYLGPADWTEGSEAVLLTIAKSTLDVKMVQRVGGAGGDAAQAMVLIHVDDCIYTAGAADGSEFEGETLTGLSGWVMRMGEVLTDPGGEGGEDPSHGHDADYEALGAVATHTGDSADAHDASAISFTPAGTIAATDVQAAIEEVAAEAGGSHPDLATHDTLGLATQAELDAHADDTDLHGGGGDLWTEIVATADHVITDATALTDHAPATGPSFTFAVLTGQVWHIQVYLLYSGNNTTGDYKGTIAFPGGLGWQRWIGDSGSSDLVISSTGTRITGTGGGHVLGTDASDTIRTFYLEMMVRLTSNGNITWQFANSSAAPGRTSTTRAGSILRYRKVTP